MDGAAARPIDVPLLERAFRWLADARDTRVSGAVGDSWNATLVRTADPARLPDVPLLQESEHRCLVRLSRGLGLPGAVPDVLGVGIRVLAVGQPPLPQDLLLSSSVDAPLLHRVPVPTTWHRGIVFSSLLPYDIGGRTLHVGLRLAHMPRNMNRGVARGARFDLLLATRTDRFRTVGSLELTTPLSRRESEQLEFDAWECSEGVRPHGMLNRVLRAARNRSD